MNTVRTRLIKIGNSQGTRIPKVLHPGVCYAR